MLRCMILSVVVVVEWCRFISQRQLLSPTSITLFQYRFISSAPQSLLHHQKLLLLSSTNSGAMATYICNLVELLLPLLYLSIPLMPPSLCPTTKWAHHPQLINSALQLAMLWDQHLRSYSRFQQISPYQGWAVVL